MPSTFVHGFLPAACAYYSRRGVARLSRAQAFRFFLLAFFLGNTPDLDLIPATVFSQYWQEIHREWGHNLFTMTLLVMLGAALLRRWVSAEIPKNVAYFTAALMVLSHVLFDSMCVLPNGIRAGVPLLWPFSENEFTMPIGLFKGISLHAHGANPFWQHVVSVEFWSQLFLFEVFYGAALFVAWVCVWRIARGIGALRLGALKKTSGQPSPAAPKS